MRVIFTVDELACFGQRSIQSIRRGSSGLPMQQGTKEEAEADLNDCDDQSQSQPVSKFPCWNGPYNVDCAADCLQSDFANSLLLT